MQHLQSIPTQAPSANYSPEELIIALLDGEFTTIENVEAFKKAMKATKKKLKKIGKLLDNGCNDFRIEDDVIWYTSQSGIQDIQGI